MNVQRMVMDYFLASRFTRRAASFVRASQLYMFRAL